MDWRSKLDRRGWACAALILLLACPMRESGDPRAGGNKDPDAFRVVLLGAVGRESLVQDLNQASRPGVVFISSPAGADILTTADQARGADLGLIVVDATDGPVQVTREHIVLARQLRFPRVALGSGDPILLFVAFDAVREWKFEPARRNGEPVPVYYNLAVNFRIDVACLSESGAVSY